MSTSQWSEHGECGERAGIVYWEGQEEGEGEEWKMTYGSLGTGVGVSDGNPFTTVASASIHGAW